MLFSRNVEDSGFCSTALLCNCLISTDFLWDRSEVLNMFHVGNLPLSDLKLVDRHRVGDARGFLSRIFCADELASIGWRKPIAQINHTATAKRGTVRGMHFQYPPHAEMKLVSCLRGEVWDCFAKFD